MADETTSNTGENRPNKGRFTKGDPRINRKGRPKSFDALRKLAQQICCEVVVAKDNSVAMSRVELILRDWSGSKDARKQQAFMELAYGKVPNPVEVTGKDGAPIETKDVGLSDDERAERIAAILDKARARRDRQTDGNDTGPRSTAV